MTETERERRIADYADSEFSWVGCLAVPVWGLFCWGLATLMSIFIWRDHLWVQVLFILGVIVSFIGIFGVAGKIAEDMATERVDGKPAVQARTVRRDETIERRMKFTYYRSIAICVSDGYFAPASRFLWSPPGAGARQGCRGWWLDTAPLEVGPDTPHGVWGCVHAIGDLTGGGAWHNEGAASRWMDGDRCWLVELQGYGTGLVSENGVARFPLAVIQRVLGYGRNAGGALLADPVPVMVCGGFVYPQGECPQHGVQCDGSRVGVFTGADVLLAETLEPWPGFFTRSPFLDIAYVDIISPVVHVYRDRNDAVGGKFIGRCRFCGEGVLPARSLKRIQPVCQCGLASRGGMP